MPLASTSAAELAEDWLTAKRDLGSAAQAEKGNSDRARRADLERWAPRRRRGAGRSPTEDGPALVRLVLSDLSEEVLVGAAAAKRRWSDATVARMLSTLRGFTRWLHRAGYLQADPLDADLFRAPARPERRPRAPDAEDVERILAAACEDPSGRHRMFWPTRDVALLRLLATTGARAEEACGVTIGELDRRASAHFGGWAARRAARPGTSPSPAQPSMPSKAAQTTVTSMTSRPKSAAPSSSPARPAACSPATTRGTQ